MKRLLNYALLALIGFWAFPARSADTDSYAKPPKSELARQILADQSLRDAHRMAQDLLKSGLNAGSGYGEV